MGLDERDRFGNLGKEGKVVGAARLVAHRHQSEDLAQAADRRRVRRQHVRDDPIVIEALDGQRCIIVQDFPCDPVVGPERIDVDRRKTVQDRAAEVGVGLGALERGNRQPIQGQAFPRPRPQVDLQLALPDIVGQARECLGGIVRHRTVTAGDGCQAHREHEANTH